MRSTHTARSNAGAARAALALIAAAVALCPRGAGMRLHADEIVLADGTRLEDVRVTSATPERVEYRQGRARRAIAADTVESIHRDSERLEVARTLHDAGDDEAAIERLRAVEGDSDAEAWERAEARYLRGVAEARLGRVTDASATFEAYLADHKESGDWWLPHVLRSFGEMLLDRNRPGTAEVYFKELEQLGGRWDLAAKLGRGKALLRSRGKAGTQDARLLFNEVARRAESRSMKAEAQVERIRAIVVAEQYDQAIAELEEEFFAASGAGSVLYDRERARATLLMAEAHLGLGGAGDDAGRASLERAEVWLLTVAALHGEHREVFATGCDLLVDLYDRLDQRSRAEEWRRRKTEAGGSIASPREPARGT